MDDIDYIVMSDDGRGRDLTIPGVLINYADGKKLSDFYKDNKNNQNILDSIVLEVDFEMEHPNNTVKYDIFMTSDNEAVYKLLNELYHYQVELKDQAILNVHYVTYQSPLYSRDSPKEVPNCLGAGKYCNSPGKFGTTDGRKIVSENLRQKCIFQYAEKNDMNVYWKYMNSFYTKCLSKAEPDFSEECGAIVLTDQSIKDDAVNKCIKESWKPSQRVWNAEKPELYAENSVFEDENNKRNMNLISYLPSILVNGRNFYGSWRADNVFEAICAGFKKKPDICYIEGAFSKASGLGWFGITMIVLLIIAVNAVVFYFCKNYIRRKIVERIESTDINHKINTVVTSYLALRDSK
jgi:hypothetical protein